MESTALGVRQSVNPSSDVMHEPVMEQFSDSVLFHDGRGIIEAVVISVPEVVFGGDGLDRLKRLGARAADLEHVTSESHRWNWGQHRAALFRRSAFFVGSRNSAQWWQLNGKKLQFFKKQCKKNLETFQCSVFATFLF